MDSIKEATTKVQQAILALNGLNINTTPDNVKTMFFVFAQLGEVQGILSSISNDSVEENQNGRDD